jgi:hypothetical protein
MCFLELTFYLFRCSDFLNHELMMNMAFYHKIDPDWIIFIVKVDGIFAV